jgi:hypothetical protein
LRGGEAAPLTGSNKPMALTLPVRARLLTFVFNCQLGRDHHDNTRLPDSHLRRLSVKRSLSAFFVIAFIAI